MVSGWMKDRIKPHTSLRRRITVTATLSTMLASAALSLVAIGIVKSAASDQIDRSLRRSSQRPLPERHMDPPFAGGPAQRGGTPILLQISTLEGKKIWSNGAAQDIGGLPKPSIPDGTNRYFFTKKIDGEHFRIFERRISRDRVVQAARPLFEQREYLRNLQLVLLGASVVVTVTVLLLSRFLAVSVLRPISTMTDTVVDISQTHDLSSRVSPPFGDAEVVDLADAFNEMLDSIDEARKQQLRFVADASHELKTPLTGIVGNSDYLIRHADGLSTDGRESVEAISRDAQRLTTLSSNLAMLAALDATQNNSGRTTLPSIEPVNIRTLILEEVDRTARAYPNAQIRVTNSDELTLKTSPELMRRVVSNLLVNAALHGGQNVEISYGSTSDNQLFIDVADDGAGISVDELPHLFDRFWRSRRSQNSPGSGLGLSIVSEACRILGGSVDASNSSDSGLIIKVTIPLNS